MSMFNLFTEKIESFIRKRINRWLSKRVPSNFQHKLSSRNIFIMPTRFGFAYLFLDVLLFLLGTNYQNNIILLLSYLLASLFITLMLHSFYNFSRITFTSSAKQFTFAKQSVHFPIKIIAKKIHYDLNFHFSQQGDLSKKVKLEQGDIGESQVLLPILVLTRGVHNLGRVKVSSEYPLGLFITWAMLDFSHQLVAFPKPKKLRSNQNYLSGLDDSKQSSTTHSNLSAGIDDFSELKSYVVGESQARIAWKQLARGQGKLSKHYQNQQGSLHWLKLSDMPSADFETKLSFLCFLVLEHSKNEHDFGLLLDIGLKEGTSTEAGRKIVKIKPSSGYQHRQNCLIALAQLRHRGGM